MNYKINRLEEAKILNQEGKLREAVEILLDISPQNFQIEVGIISANVNNLYFEKNLGTISNSDFNLTFNQRSLAVAELLEKLKKHFIGDNFAYIFNQAVELNKEKKYDIALELLDKANKLDPANSLVLIERGLAKMNIFLFSEAIVDFCEAIEKKPINPYVYFLRAQAYDAMGLKEKSEQDIQKFNEFGIDFNQLK